MRFSQIVQIAPLAAAFVWWATSAPAVTVKVDYRYDTLGFFGNSNPQGGAGGAQARAAVEAAAAFYSNLLDDTLSAIQTPPEFHSSVYDGTASWEWSASFFNPQTSGNEAINNEPIASDQYLLFVGARSLSGSDVGAGTSGTHSWSYVSSGDFTSQEYNYLNSTKNQFASAVDTRGETHGFADWGGSLSFDSDAATHWHFNHNTQPSGNEVDFYSVAIHEIAHALGFGTFSAVGPSEWSKLVNGTTFIGPTAQGIYGGTVPLVSSLDRSHWRNGIASKVIGSSANQEAAMDPSLNQGNRKLLTELDAAALVDLGWEINLTPGVPGDYNGNGVVDTADYLVWRATLGSDSDMRANGDNAGASAGVIDQADFVFWRAHFGNTDSGAASGNRGGPGSVPEPASALSLWIGVGWLGLLPCRAHRMRRCWGIAGARPQPLSD